MICIPIIGPDNKSALEQVAWAQTLADFVELRLDMIEGADGHALIKASEKPVIATCRPISCGGRYVGDEEERLALLRRAAHAGAFYVDVELPSAAQIGDIGQARLIVSHHDFERTPDNLPQIYSRIAEFEPDVIKIVTYANGVSDNLKVFDLLKNARMTTTAFCMGHKGTFSRILGRKFGSAFTYAALHSDEITADGQITAREIRDFYNYESIGPETKVYGVVGEDLSMSLSHVYHNLAFGKAETPAVYVKFPVADIRDFLEKFRHIFDGLSVTRPHKETIMPLLDETSAVAKRIGSVNTVSKIEGRLVGDNFDHAGAVKALGNATKVSGKTATIIGAGGTARALAYGMKGLGANIVIVDRTLSRAEKLAKDVEGVVKNFDFLHSHNYQILANATPVGSDPFGEETLVPALCLRKDLLVFDVVYPHKTRLLRDAESAGCRTVSGMDMFVNQAYEQMKIWVPPEARREITRESLERDFYKMIGSEKAI